MAAHEELDPQQYPRNLSYHLLPHECQVCVCIWGAWVGGGWWVWLYLCGCVCVSRCFLLVCVSLCNDTVKISFIRARVCVRVRAHTQAQTHRTRDTSSAAKLCCQALLPSTAAKSLANTHVHIINTQTLYANIDTQTSSPTPSLAYTHRMLDRANRTHRPPTHGRSHTFIVPA